MCVRACVLLLSLLLLLLFVVVDVVVVVAVVVVVVTIFYRNICGEKGKMEKRLGEKEQNGGGIKIELISQEIKK